MPSRGRFAGLDAADETEADARTDAGAGADAGAGDAEADADVPDAVAFFFLAFCDASVFMPIIERHTHLTNRLPSVRDQAYVRLGSAGRASRNGLSSSTVMSRKFSRMPPKSATSSVMR
eukprot:PhM_4_TR10357/c6_g1_i2/m.80274